MQGKKKRRNYVFLFYDPQVCRYISLSLLIGQSYVLKKHHISTIYLLICQTAIQ